MGPTKQQERILCEDGACVVIAGPGSGKTYVMAEKIRAVIPTLADFQGVIAISFTNKASRELRNRVLRNGFDPKSSWFGTIDSFCNSEINIPFGSHFFGRPNGEIHVVEKDKLEKKWKSELKDLFYVDNPGSLPDTHFELLGKAYKEGVIILDYMSVLALNILRRSKACQRYLAARYTHVFVDEYQDSDEAQHEIFLELSSLGLCGVAVGDVNQSIFTFADKNPRYLTELTDKADFKTYAMNKNHRCHPAIVNYSTRLLARDADLIECQEVRVLEKCVNGSEEAIGSWLNDAVPYYARQFDVEDVSDLAVLVRGKRTAHHVVESLTIPHRFVDTTPLDSLVSIWAGLFRRILYYAANPRDTRYETMEELGAFGTRRATTAAMIKALEGAAAGLKQGDTARVLASSKKVAELLAPKAHNLDALKALRKVVGDDSLLRTYYPPTPGEIDVMTLHKGKGLEFSVVFHLDLYRFIIPMYKGDFVADLNLHYVGVTRAKKATILCHSTERHKANGEVVSAEPSEFLQRNGVEVLRKVSPI